MEKLDISDVGIVEQIAENNCWEEGKFHVSINRLYLDVVCPNDCPSNKVSAFGFCYCEEGCPHGEVCYSYDGAMHRFGTKSMV